MIHDVACMEDLERNVSRGWQKYFERWANRNARMSKIDRVVTGDWGIRAEDDMPLENGTPNIIHVALEDTAEAASLAPTVRATPTKKTAGAKESALLMESWASPIWRRPRSIC